MDIDTEIEKNINLIIENQYKNAHDSFLELYLQYPDNLKLLFGVIISDILVYNIQHAYNFIIKESEVAPYKNLINDLAKFIRINTNFNNLSKVSSIYNIGLFLKKHNIYESRMFFKICLYVEPEYKKALTALAEFSLMDNNFTKGINLYYHASK